MKEQEISKRELTLLQKFDPQMKEVDLPGLVIHPECLDDVMDGIEMLAASLEELGQGRPIICHGLATGKVEILEGARIVQAALKLGWRAVTAIVLQKLPSLEILPLMYALKSHQRRHSYKLMAKRFDSVKRHARELIKNDGLPDDGGEALTVRKYLQKVLGFSNEHYESDFEAILKSENRDYLLEMLESGALKFSKAAKMANGKAIQPKVDNKSYTKPSNMFMCEDCPNRKKFLDGLDNPDFISDPNDLPKNDD